MRLLPKDLKTKSSQSNKRGADLSLGGEDREGNKHPSLWMFGKERKVTRGDLVAW